MTRKNLWEHVKRAHEAKSEMLERDCYRISKKAVQLKKLQMITASACDKDTTQAAANSLSLLLAAVAADVHEAVQDRGLGLQPVAAPVLRIAGM